MKTFIRVLTVLLVVFGTVFNTTAQDVVKKKIAVYISGDDAVSSIKKVFGSKLVGAIANSNGYAAVERTAEFLEALSSETDYQTSGEVRDNQIASLGQRFGVRFVIVADISEVFDEYFISSRLINVESGLVERSFDTNGPAESMAQLVTLADRIAEGMIIKPEQAEMHRVAMEKQRAEEQQRLEEEKRRQQQEEVARQQRLRQEQLRQTAINNLINGLGYKCYQIGNYLIMDDIINVKFKYDSSRNTVLSINRPPAGWLTATEDILIMVYQYGRYNHYVPDSYWMVLPVTAYPNRQEKFNNKKMTGSWVAICFSTSMTLRKKTIGQTIKERGSDAPIFEKNNDSYWTLYYRPMFTEQEIQTEINRISR